MKRLQKREGAETPKVTVAQKIEELMTRERAMKRREAMDGLLLEGQRENTRLHQEEAKADR